MAKSQWSAQSPMSPNNRAVGGKTTITLTAVSQAFTAVVFPTPFAAPPAVVVTTENALYFGAVASVTTTGCNVYAVHRDGTAATTSVVAHWVAAPL